MVEPRPSAHDMTLPAFVPKRGGHMQQMSIDSWYAAAARRSAANQPMPLLLSTDGTQRRTDGRTDTRPLQRPCCSYCTE